MLGEHCLKTWSSTQRAIVLSSAEAEFYALVDAVLRAKWAQSVLFELGVPVSPVAEACTVSSAAKSFVSRRGLGKMRHMELRYLWVQEMVKDGRMKVRRVNGEEKPADYLTKPKSLSEMTPMIGKAGGVLIGRVEPQGAAARPKRGRSR